MESFDLAILFTAAGALVGAGLIKVIVSAAKGFGYPSTGRAVMVLALVLSTGLIALALLDNDLLSDGVDGADILLIVLSILNVYAASIGVHETAVKVQNISQGTTNPSGPDQ